METVTLRQVKSLLRSLAHEQSLLLLSPPGVGKSDIVAQAAAEAKLPVRSLLGTQIAPEDVSGIPRIVGERSVFCPPRLLLPDNPEPFCLFLDELPACAPDIQKSFYSLLLERRLGEHQLPPGTWVVAAGNRIEDRALVRTLSSALINRVFVVQVRVDAPEWLDWAERNHIRFEIRDYIKRRPEALLRPVPARPEPFSTPRAWASLSRALDRAEQAGILTRSLRRALIHGRVSAEDFRDLCQLAVGTPLTLAAIAMHKEGLFVPDKIQTIKRFRDRVHCGLYEAKVSVEAVLSMTEADMDRYLEQHRDKQQPEDESVDATGRITVTLSQAKSLIRTLAAEESVLFLSPPGVGKSDSVMQAAQEAGLPARSLLGTQISPEDVSGIPRIVGERSVFCPPRVLLPEKPEPFCLFLDELPACAPDIQKAFYSLLLERRIGEHALPAGTWVVAAGNRLEDRALVRSISAALINRVFLLEVRADRKEWLKWARANRVRGEIIAFLTFMPEALLRPVPPEPVPFSTPRAWASLSEALDMADQAGLLTPEIRRALTFGRVTAQDAAVFCAMAEETIGGLLPIKDYLQHPEQLPAAETGRWFILCRIRHLAQAGELRDVPKETVNHFLTQIPEEHRFALLVDLVQTWADLGATQAMLDTLKEVTGL